MYDIIVVGTGFSGSILARRFAEEHDKKVLLLEKRNHIAGNMYDEYNEYGILIQKYGPHFINTDNYWIIDYLSKYAKLYEHTVKLYSFIDGQYVRLPFNFQTVQQLLTPQKAEPVLKALRESFKGEDRVSIFDLVNHEDERVREYGTLLFEKAYKTYTMKQWGLTTEQIDPDVLNRVKMALNYDERYLNKDFQYLPVDGFTALFEKLLDHPNIELRLNTDALDKITFSGDKVLYDGIEPEALIYTGAIDELFDEKYGKLPYRSLKFAYESQEGHFALPCEIVSYPQADGYTRKTEYKQFNPCKAGCKHTTVVTEYPVEYIKDDPVANIPYYPVINDKNVSLYERYKKDAESFKNLFLSGRLAEYRYFNMDVVIEHTFEAFEIIKKCLNLE